MLPVEGDFIRQFREANGISQADFGKMVGVSNRTIQNWESGNKIPSTKIDKIKEVIEGYERKSFTSLFTAQNDDATNIKEVLIQAQQEQRPITEAELRNILDRVQELEMLEKRWYATKKMME